MKKTLKTANPHLQQDDASRERLARSAASSTAVETGKPTEAYFARAITGPSRNPSPKNRE